MLSGEGGRPFSFSVDHSAGRRFGVRCDVRRTRWLIACVVAVLAFVPGCGGCAARERDKNSDLDRPKPVGKAPEKR